MIGVLCFFVCLCATCSEANLEQDKTEGPSVRRFIRWTGGEVLGIPILTLEGKGAVSFDQTSRTLFVTMNKTVLTLEGQEGASSDQTSKTRCMKMDETVYALNLSNSDPSNPGVAVFGFDTQYLSTLQLLLLPSSRTIGVNALGRSMRKLSVSTGASAYDLPHSLRERFKKSLFSKVTSDVYTCPFGSVCSAVPLDVMYSHNPDLRKRASFHDLETMKRGPMLRKIVAQYFVGRGQVLRTWRERQGNPYDGVSLSELESASTDDPSISYVIAAYCLHALYQDSRRRVIDVIPCCVKSDERGTYLLYHGKTNVRFSSNYEHIAGGVMHLLETLENFLVKEEMIFEEATLDDEATLV